METIAITVLAGSAIWLGVGFIRQRLAIRRLARLLRREDGLPTAPGEDSAFISPFPASFRALASSVLNSVSEAELARASEARQREFLEALLNEINDAIFILDQDREIRFVNEAAKRLFPSQQRYQERAFLDVCRDHRIYDTLLLAEDLGAKTSDRIDLRVKSASNDRMREIKLHVEAEPLQFPGMEEGTGSWLLLRDITAELETDQIRRDFVANASHELRTPLSIINGYLETMDDPEVDLNQPIYRRAVHTMSKHGDRLARIVDDMLTISKLEDENDLLAHQAFDLRDSVDEMISHLMPLIEEKHARVEVDVAADGNWTLTGDRYYWDQVFFNLIENALKQNREPGLRITVRFREENGRIIISIADDGIGIPAKDLPLVFKRFYRVQKHHAQTEVKGTGLGLSIVKRAVEAHHGTVSVDSRPGIETIFTISVPQTSIAVGRRASGKEG